MMSRKQLEYYTEKLKDISIKYIPGILGIQ